MAVVRHLHRHEGSLAGINMTPMIDITFLLLTFFMLASHFASAEKIAMELPQPDRSRAEDRRFPEKIIVNVLYEGPDAAPGLAFGAVHLDSLPALAEHLAELAAAQSQTEVILRADKRLNYGEVRQVMAVIADSGLRKLQLVAELE